MEPHIHTLWSIPSGQKKKMRGIFIQAHKHTIARAHCLYVWQFCVLFNNSLRYDTQRSRVIFLFESMFCLFPTAFKWNCFVVFSLFFLSVLFVCNIHDVISYSCSLKFLCISALFLTLFHIMTVQAVSPLIFTRWIVHRSDKLSLKPLCYTQNHHIILNRRTIQMIKCDMLRHRQSCRIL